MKLTMGDVAQVCNQKPGEKLWKDESKVAQPKGAEVHGSAGQEAASIYIVETMDSRFSLTMHLRGADLRGPYTLNAEVSYPEIGQVDQAQVVFETA